MTGIAASPIRLATGAEYIGEPGDMLPAHMTRYRRDDAFLALYSARR